MSTHSGSCPGRKHAIINLLHHCPTISLVGRALISPSSWMLLATTHHEILDLFPDFRMLKNVLQVATTPGTSFTADTRDSVLIISPSCKREEYFLGPWARYIHQILSSREARLSVLFTIIFLMPRIATGKEKGLNKYLLNKEAPCSQNARVYKHVNNQCDEEHAMEGGTKY